MMDEKVIIMGVFKFILDYKVEKVYIKTPSIQITLEFADFEYIVREINEDRETSISRKCPYDKCLCQPREMTQEEKDEILKEYFGECEEK